MCSLQNRICNDLLPKVFVLAVCVLSCCVVPRDLFAQTGPMAPDARPFAPTEGGKYDSVSTVNDGLQVAIPLYSIPQRGNLSLSFTLRYDSPAFLEQTDCSIPREPCVKSYDFQGDGVFLSSNLDVTIVTSAHYVQNSSTGTQYLSGYYFNVETPDSGMHKLVSIGNNQYRSLDGTGWIFDLPSFVLTSRDGTSYHFSGQPQADPTPPEVTTLNYVEDTNGNRIVLQHDSNGRTTSYVDTFGRTIPAGPTGMTYAYSGLTFRPGDTQGTRTPTTDLSGCTGPNPIDNAYV